MIRGNLEGNMQLLLRSKHSTMMMMMIMMTMIMMMIMIMIMMRILGKDNDNYK